MPNGSAGAILEEKQYTETDIYREESMIRINSNPLRLPENLIRLRREKRITQEELAAFVGVTKASVSKWENAQSTPDIFILPQLAAFFDVTVDELLGYEPQLEKKQIQKIYQELAAAFAAEPFEEVMEQSRQYVKRYYSCYPFLLSMAALWVNHTMLAKTQEEQQEILAQVSDLCSHIMEQCKEVGTSSDAMMLRAFSDLQLGRHAEVIETLEEALDPYRMTQEDSVLIQAYQMTGQTQRADAFTQIRMYQYLGGLVTDAACYIGLHRDDLTICQETIRRIDAVNEAYGLSAIHANVMAQFELQAASVYAMNDMEEPAFERLYRYGRILCWMLSDDHLTRHDDAYFNCISSWYDSSDLGNRAPRDKSVIRASALGGLSHPAFAGLADRPEFEKLRRMIEKAG